jgi:hypothetical protein
MRKTRKTAKIRRSWNINPKTRVKKSAKKYKRQDIKKQITKILKGLKDEKDT